MWEKSYITIMDLIVISKNSISKNKNKKWLQVPMGEKSSRSSRGADTSKVRGKQIFWGSIRDVGIQCLTFWHFGDVDQRYWTIWHWFGDICENICTLAFLFICRWALLRIFSPQHTGLDKVVLYVWLIFFSNTVCQNWQKTMIFSFLLHALVWYIKLTVWTMA